MNTCFVSDRTKPTTSAFRQSTLLGGNILKSNFIRIITLALSSILVCLISISALAGAPDPINVRAEYNNRYLATADGILTGSRVSASVGIYDDNEGVFVTNTYRHVNVEYSYYPDDETQPLTTRTISKTNPSTDLCTVSVSTSTNPDIYMFKRATFSMVADIPNNANVPFTIAPTTLEYTPD